MTASLLHPSNRYARIRRFNGFINAERSMFMPNHQLPEEVFLQAAEQYPTPFHLYDEGGIRRRARVLQSAFSWCSSFREYFAVKALPNPAILRILKEEGCGVDCSSRTELLLAKANGFQGEQIMFSANAMPPEEFALAREMDALINLDDISDIDLLRRHGGIPETICCRYNPGGSFTINGTIMGNPGQAKYGFTKAQLRQGMVQLKSLGAKRFGLHAFLSSNTTDQQYYPVLADLLFQLGKTLSEETGLQLAFLNLSGGIGIPYRPEQSPADIHAIGQMVKAAYCRAFPQGGVAIKTELGRWMTGPEGWLVTRAVHRKETYKTYIGVDASAVQLIRPAMYGAYHHITVCGKEHLPHDQVADVTGCLCENNDKFAIDRPLPPIGLGDVLVIHDTGAHGFSMGYNYNGRLRSAEILRQEDGSLRLIRRAETEMDYFATLEGDPCWASLRELAEEP